MKDPTKFELRLGRADSATFTGEAYSALMGGGIGDPTVKMYFVRFLPGSRTFWHIHSGPQLLVIISGECWFQRDRGPIERAEEGTTVRFEAGERHWHGASPELSMEHIAINFDPRETQWQEEALLADGASKA